MLSPSLPYTALCRDNGNVAVETFSITYVLDNQRDAVLSSLYLFYCQVTLHVLGVFRTHHQGYKTVVTNHWYKSRIWWYSDKIRYKESMVEQLPHFEHGQIRTGSSPDLAMFKVR
jgi:hypothetical protein